MNYLNEAFKTLESLNEDLFDINDIEGISDTITSQDAEVVRVIDSDAETYDDINQAYVGKIIVDCRVCHSHIFKNKEDIVITPEGDVNIEEQCPYCGEQEGFIVVGEITKYPNSEDTPVDNLQEEPASEETEPVDELKEEPVQESYMSNNRKFISRKRAVENINESVNNVNVETDDSIVNVSTEEDGKVTVTTEPKIEDSTEETIAPVSEETAEEIITANEDPVEEVDEMTDIDVEIDEIDEESIDELGESYLKNVYENVDSFRTSSVSSKNDKIIIEGIIKFKSGTEKKTGFIFESKCATKTGKVKFTGENKHLCRGNKAFTLTGKMSGSKLIAESFTYNYRAKNAEGKPTKVYGTVRTSK